MDIVVYTAIFGRKEVFIDPSWIDKNARYIMFTDRDDIKTSVYEIIKCKGQFEDSSKSAKLFKILPHNFIQSDYSLWHDGHLTITGDVLSFIQQKLSESNVDDLFLFRHPTRNCIYDEAQACIKLRKDYPETIREQIDRYIRRGYPKNNGLIRGSTIYRKHTSIAVQLLMRDWWKEVKQYSNRDQLSFNYVAWWRNIKYANAPEAAFRFFFQQNTHHNTRV